MWKSGDVVSGPATSDLFLVLHNGSFCRLRNNHGALELTPDLLGKVDFIATSSVVKAPQNRKLFNLFELIKQAGI